MGAQALGAGANVGKFLVLPAVLSARELDAAALALLIAITASQLVGEPLANRRVIAPSDADRHPRHHRRRAPHHR